jgi:hypothetical protein
MAADLGLSSTYDASRDSYPSWRKKILAFAEQLLESPVQDAPPKEMMN